MKIRVQALRGNPLSPLLRGLALIAALTAPAASEPRPAIAMHGAPALAPGFSHLPYVNPEAPQGGTLTFAATGSFDSLNPYILKGRAPWPIRAHMVESLMGRNWDEPFTLYGLLAETIEVPEDRAWVAFTLREEARFSDGTPVTVEDVIWSFETLGEVGHPRYRTAWRAVERIVATGERSLRIDFAEPDRELPLIMGLRPVLKKAAYRGADFAESGDVAPTGSGPYVLESVETGKRITFARNPDYWGADLPLMRGLNNAERLRYDYFRTGEAVWEAVKTGAIDIFADADPVRWAEGYDFPRARDGALLRTEIPHGRPSGMEGFVFNTRRALFADRRVREALALSFDWAWVNDRLFRGAYARIESYFGGSRLGWQGAAEGRERAILAPFADALPEETLTRGWRPPMGDGTGRNRRNLRAAAALLDAAGWPVVDGRRMRGGKPFAFEILVASGDHAALGELWAQALERLGVAASVRLVDQAQYEARRVEYDYDMIVNRWAMSLSPGTEQRLYFGSEGRETPGTRNYMGVAHPAVDAAIDAILRAESREGFEAAVRALDRVLSAGIYVIPFGVLPTDRIAHAAEIARPDRAPLYGWWGWEAGPGSWWRKAE